MKEITAAGVLALLASFPLVADARSVASAQSHAGNLYIGGGEVSLAEPVIADLYAAGGKVTVTQPVAEDAALAGGQVAVLAPVGQDLRIAGGKVSVDAAVGGDLVATGGDVSIGKESRIGGDMLLAGGDVRFSGVAMGSARLTGGTLAVAGEINGDAALYGGNIVLQPGARIAGNLTYASSEPLSDTELALVSGNVRREEPRQDWAPRTGAAWFHPVFFVSMLVCGSLLFILFPNAASGAQQAMRQTPWRSLLVGIALLCTLPVVAILFIVSIIGIPLGFTLLVLYPVLLLLGYLGAAFFISRIAAGAMHQAGRSGRAWQVGFLALGLVLLALAGTIPFLGGLLVFLAVVAGVGGWAQWLYRRYRASHPAIAAQP